jgi:hypothetical protein
MPIIYEASVIRRNARARKGLTRQATAIGANNTVAAVENALRVDLVLRNLLGVPGFPAGGDTLFYDYFDNPNILTEGFPLEPGASIAVQPNQALYVRSNGGNIPYSVDEGLE